MRSFLPHGAHSDFYSYLWPFGFCSTHSFFASSRRSQFLHLIGVFGISPNPFGFCFIAPMPIFTPNRCLQYFAKTIRFLLYRAGPNFYT